MKQIVLLVTLLFAVLGCGFAPVYESNNLVDFQIKSVNYEGDQELNDYINIGLKKYIKKNDENSIFKISTITKYTKTTQSKDAKGNIQSFNVEGIVTFIVTGNNQNLKFTYSEQSTLNNSDDTFELNSYENSIKQNFASSMVEKLILDISSRQ